MECQYISCKIRADLIIDQQFINETLRMVQL